MDYSSEITLDKIKITPKVLVDSVLSRCVIPKNIHVINDASDDLQILIDPTKIECAFTNLIVNSIDAMPTGGTLKITTKTVQDSLQIDFSDTGTGMSKEVLEQLWTPFFTTKAKGMGIGLSICKRLVEAHQGKIAVHSVEGKGTTFSVFLRSTK